jgi:hypothetical protein
MVELSTVPLDFASCPAAPVVAVFPPLLLAAPAVDERFPRLRPLSGKVARCETHHGHLTVISANRVGTYLTW